MINVEHNIAIFVDLFRVCDVITREVEIGVQLRQRYQNGTINSYGFCLPPKLTNLWTKILLKYFFVCGPNG